MGATLLVLLFWVGGAFFVSQMAKGNGKSPALWFIISMIFDPIIGLIALLVISGK